MPGNLEELRALVRRLHVHYDVEPELEVRSGARVKVGLLVRLWGVHAKGAGALPGCAKCQEIIALLKPVAEFALDHETHPMQVTIEPLRRALYDSRVVPDADEVALPIRITPAAVRPTSSHAGEDRCLKEIRARLKALGVPER